MQAFSSWVPEEFLVAYLCEFKDTVLAPLCISNLSQLPTSGLTQYFRSSLITTVWQFRAKVPNSLYLGLFVGNLGCLLRHLA
ncbi:hypothetical protein Y032_0151g2826 [Ancylostoma ceylanicum]|nr:hypothetical protein Y032_0151g2826 [Ancylostoma ceylanicum]